eukprot:XP_020403673.1 uncharacterized protein LOC103645807 isoform X3 [Zea mays]
MREEKVKKGCNFKVKDSLLKTLEETQKRDMIMLPILDGSHWQLVCINFLHREINYFDSLGSDFCAAESLMIRMKLTHMLIKSKQNSADPCNVVKKLDVNIKKYSVSSRKVITSKNLTMLMGLIDQEIEEINAKKRKRSGHPAGQPELKDDDGQLRANAVKARDAELGCEM